MRAWQLERLSGRLEFTDLPIPEARPGSVLVRMEASSLMSYMKDYVEGKLPIYHPPKGNFIPGGNGGADDYKPTWYLTLNTGKLLSQGRY